MKIWHYFFSLTPCAKVRVRPVIIEHSILCESISVSLLNLGEHTLFTDFLEEPFNLFSLDRFPPSSCACITIPRPWHPSPTLSVPDSSEHVMSIWPAQSRQVSLAPSGQPSPFRSAQSRQVIPVPQVSPVPSGQPSPVRSTQSLQVSPEPPGHACPIRSGQSLQVNPAPSSQPSSVPSGQPNPVTSGELGTPC